MNQALRMLWKWTEMGDPTLPGHGSLKEIKNKSAALADPMTVLCFFKDDQTEMKVEFKDSGQFKLGPCKKNIHELPFISYVRLYHLVFTLLYEIILSRI